MKQMLKILKQHQDWRKQSLNLIASENILSPAVRKALDTDLLGRYAEGTAGKRFYQGLVFFDQMEQMTTQAFADHFKASFVDIRPISGAVANLAVFSALTSPGDTIITLGIDGGSHISHEKMGASGLLGLNIHHFDIDANGQIDIKKAQEKILELKPKFIILSGSVILFPMPVKELKEACAKVGAKIVYDAAHVFGLIFSGYFQNPLSEGADIIVASTHKTFPGPQGGIIIGNIDPELQKAIQRKIFPGITSNHHLYRIPGLYTAFSEMKKYGKQYMGQTIKNAKALASALEKNGFDVCYKQKGFTASHQVLINVANCGGGTDVAKKLEDANIIVNKNMILGDKSALNPSGIRIGVQEITRMGAKEKEMKTIANLFKQLLLDNIEISKVKKQVVAFRRKYQKVKFSL